jgi:hypothetical protein
MTLTINKFIRFQLVLSITKSILCKDSGGRVLTSVIIGEAEYSSYGKEAATKTRQRDIEAVGNRATGRNHY